MCQQINSFYQLGLVKWFLPFWICESVALTRCCKLVIFAVLLTSSKFIALPVPGILEGTLKIRESRDRATPLFWKKNNYGHLFRLSLWIGLPNFTFVALPIPEILGGTLKNFGSHVTRSRPFFEKNDRGVLLRLTRWIVLPNFTFVALPIPKILGGTFKILVITWPGPRPFLRKK